MRKWGGNEEEKVGEIGGEWGIEEIRVGKIGRKGINGGKIGIKAGKRI